MDAHFLKALHLRMPLCPRRGIKLQAVTTWHSQKSHMVTSMRKIMWPRAPLSTATASPAGAEESEGEQRQRGATDNTPDTSPLPSKPFLERGTRDTRRGSGVPNRGATSEDPRTRPWDEAQPRDPPREGLQPARPPAARSAETRRPPPLCRGGGAALARTHIFFFLRLLSRAGEKASKAERREASAATPERAGGVRASARRGGQPRRPGARSLARAPAPARSRLPAGVAPKTRTTGTFLTGSWVRGDWQISSPGSGLAM